MSLKSTQNIIATKKQVYKPILDNPYTDVGAFPHVNSQHEIKSLLELSVLKTFNQFCRMQQNNQQPLSNMQCPVDIVFGFNKVMQYLESDIDEPCFVFVCNKDGLTTILHQHLPMLVANRNSKPNKQHMTRLIQLPKSSLDIFNANLPLRSSTFDQEDGDYHYGILLVKGENIPGSLRIHVHTNVPDVSIPYLETSYVPCSENLHLLSTSMSLQKKERKGKVLKKKKNMIKK